MRKRISYIEAKELLENGTITTSCAMQKYDGGGWNGEEFVVVKGKKTYYIKQYENGRIYGWKLKDKDKKQIKEILGD